MNNTIYKIILGGSASLLLCALFVGIFQIEPGTGPFLIGALVCLALGIRGFKATKQFAFTAWILTVVAAAMYYPHLFQEWGGFRLTALITPLIQIIMFGMGSQMSLNDFKGVLKMPKAVSIGVIMPFIIMPLTAFAITRIFYSGGDWDPAILAGIILVGSVPSGLASNVMVFIAKGNLPLSITMTSVSTMLAPIVTPLLMLKLAGTMIEVNAMSMMINTFNMVILPIIAGFVFNIFYNRTDTRKSIYWQLISYLAIIIGVGFLILSQGTEVSAAARSTLQSIAIFMILPAVGAMILRYFLKGDREIIKTILSSFSTVGIAAIVTVTTAAGRDALLAVGFLLVFTNFLHNITGYSLGYLFAKLMKMDERDCRTIAFETGMQNGGMASGLAAGMGKIATVGLAPAVWGPIMNTTGSILASWWGANPPKEKNIAAKEDDENNEKSVVES